MEIQPSKLETQSRPHLILRLSTHQPRSRRAEASLPNDDFRFHLMSSAGPQSTGRSEGVPRVWVHRWELSGRRGEVWMRSQHAQKELGAESLLGNIVVSFQSELKHEFSYVHLRHILGFPGSSVGKKNPPVMRETWVRSLGWEDPLEKGSATHSSILVWRIPWNHNESDTTK